MVTKLCSSMAGLPELHKDPSCHHSHRPNEPAARVVLIDMVPYCVEYCGPTTMAIMELGGTNR